jgi:hypothetical protein
MTRSRILPILGALVLAGSQSAMAASPYNPEADFVARLGGRAFTVERTEGGALNRNPSAEAAGARIVGNPLRNRAETLAGKAFTVENAEGKAFRRENPGDEAASVRTVGNPLRDRAETLAGKPFTVERAGRRPEIDRSQSYLARFE